MQKYLEGYKLAPLAHGSHPCLTPRRCPFLPPTRLLLPETGVDLGVLSLQAQTPLAPHPTT